MNSNRKDVGIQDHQSEDELKVYRALLQAAKIEMDQEALDCIASLLRFGVPPDEVYQLIKQIVPVCGLLRKFKIKPHKSNHQ